MDFNRKLLSSLVVALLLAASPRIASSETHGCQDYPECCNLEEYIFQNAYGNLDELILDLRHRWVRSGDFRIIQNWTDIDAPTAPHHQYALACFFFAVSPILESLGHSKFEQFAHMHEWFAYWSGVDHWFEADVGFWGSPEQLMLDYATFDSYLGAYSQQVIGGLENFPSFGPTIHDCASNFAVGEEYAFCDPRTGTHPVWLDQIVGSTKSGPFGLTCGGENDAPCGAIWFLNNNGSWGCNDAWGITVDTSDRLHYRRLIKAFVDNDTPLLASVSKGGHWVAIIGYSELDYNGLPRKAIIADSVGKRYWIAHNLQSSKSWNKDGYCSISSIVPWNYYADGGCEPDGWAKELDALLPSPIDLCQLSDVSCHEPYYGIEVACEDDGINVAKFHAKPTDPFIEVDQDMVCDAVTLRYSDGIRRVTSARAKRFRGPGTWQLLSDYYADSVLNPLLTSNSGRMGRSIVIWDSVWMDNYWLVATGASSQYTQRRTELELDFNDGTSKTIEIAPSETYNVRLYCHDNGDILASWRSNTDHEYFEDRGVAPREQLQFFHELGDRTCDEIELIINLGEEQEIMGAQIERWGYRRHSIGSFVWRQWDLLSAWPPDIEEVIKDGLSGETVRIIWDDAWPDNWWAVADNVGPGSDQDRKTRIILTLESGAERIIDLEPI